MRRRERDHQEDDDGHEHMFYPTDTTGKRAFRGGHVEHDRKTGSSRSGQDGARARPEPTAAPRRGGGRGRPLLAERRRQHPVRVFLVAILSGYAILVGLSVAAGLLFTELLLPVDRFERWEDGIFAGSPIAATPRSRMPRGSGRRWPADS